MHKAKISCLLFLWNQTELVSCWNTQSILLTITTMWLMTWAGFFSPCGPLTLCAYRIQTARGWGLGICLLSKFPVSFFWRDLESHWSSDEILTWKHFLLPRTLRARSGFVLFYCCWTPMLWVEFVRLLSSLHGVISTSSNVPLNFVCLSFVLTVF